jgi:hypothetical protein
MPGDKNFMEGTGKDTTLEVEDPEKIQKDEQQLERERKLKEALALYEQAVVYKELIKKFGDSSIERVNYTKDYPERTIIRRKEFEKLETEYNSKYSDVALKFGEFIKSVSKEGANLDWCISSKERGTRDSDIFWGENPLQDRDEIEKKILEAIG